MTISVSPALNDARLQAVLDFMSVGGTPAIDFYAAPRPANGAVTVATLLATIDLPSPWATLANHALTFVVPQDGMVLESGTVAWCRFRNGADAFAMDASVTLTGGGGDVLVSSLNVYLGGTLELVSGTLG